MPILPTRLDSHSDLTFGKLLLLRSKSPQNSSACAHNQRSIVRASTMAAQNHSVPEHEQVSLSRQSSGIDPADYEVAAQLIHHSQGRRESGEGYLGSVLLDPKEPIDGTVGHSDATNEGSGDTGGRENARRSSSQDRLGESQYLPLNLAPTNGQRCR